MTGKEMWAVYKPFLTPTIILFVVFPPVVLFGAAVFGIVLLVKRVISAITNSGDDELDYEEYIKDRKETLKQEIEKWEVENPCALSEYPGNTFSFITAHNGERYICHFRNDDVENEIEYIVSEATGAPVPLKRPYWPSQELYKFWEDIYQNEQEQFVEFDNLLNESTTLTIDISSFIPGRPVYSEDIEVFATVLEKQGYAVDRILGRKICLTTELD